MMIVLTRFLLIIALLGLPISSTPAQSNGGHSPLVESGRAEKLVTPPAASELEIVSYNIRWRSGKELQQIIRWLQDAGSLRPAIIGLQEVDRAKKRSGHANHAKALADSLGMYYAWAAPHTTKSKAQEEETGV